MSQPIPPTDHVLGPVDQIPVGRGRAFDVNGAEVVVFHTSDGALYATEGRCPHEGALLSRGFVGATSVVCPLHYWKFDLQTGDVLNGDCGLKTYPVRADEAGQIVLSWPTETPV